MGFIGERLRGNTMTGNRTESPRGRSSSERVSEKISEKLRGVQGAAKGGVIQGVFANASERALKRRQTQKFLGWHVCRTKLARKIF